MQTVNLSRWKFALTLSGTGIIFLVCGVITGKYLSEENKPDKRAVPHAQIRSEIVETRDGEGYRFINPLMECDLRSPNMHNVAPLQANISSRAAQALANRQLTHLSVYYRDLNSGQWFGVNEKADYAPASLLKLPMLIAAFKKSESEKDFLKKKVTFSKVFFPDKRPNITDHERIQLGQTYTIEELAERMIVHSDNEAMQLVFENTGEGYLEKTFADLGILIRGTTDADDYVSVKDYSNCFRLLYNATYLSKELSERALNLLSRTTFGQGIVAGVQRGTVVAHKFGERGIDRAGLSQLHDCGIVYLREAPYLICIMTRGYNMEVQANIIREVSALVYNDLSRQPYASR